jgi:hypothetical protein
MVWYLMFNLESAAHRNTDPPVGFSDVSLKREADEITKKAKSATKTLIHV